MKSSPRLGRAEVLSVEWLQLLQLLAHQGSLQGSDVEGALVLLEEEWKTLGRTRMGKSMVGPSDSESA